MTWWTIEVALRGANPEAVATQLVVATGQAVAAGPLAVVIDPETAFGSGDHGSTRGALLLVDRLLVPGGLVLDLGSGSGVLAIGAVKLGAGAALGIEVDEEAVPIAEVNALRNDVADRVRFLAGIEEVEAPLFRPLLGERGYRTLDEVIDEGWWSVAVTT